MAVVPMQKIQLLVHQSDVDAALDIAQRHGAIEFQPTATAADTTTPTLAAPQADLLARLDHAVEYLKPFAPKVGMLKSLREGTQQSFTEEAVQKTLVDTDAVEDVVRDLERIQVESAEKNDFVRTLEEQRDLLHLWKKAPFKLEQLETEKTVTKLVHTTLAADLSAQLQTLLTEADVPHALTSLTAQTVAVTIEKDPATSKRVTELVHAAKASIVAVPKGNESAEVELTRVEEELAKAKGDVALLLDQSDHAAKLHLKQLYATQEILSWQRDRFAALSNGAATASTVVLGGWVKEADRPKIEAEFAAKNIAAVLTEVERTEGEEPPVDIENNALIEPFEIVTRLYGMPGHKDLDPTAFLAAFFFLFFGLALTDVGYGLALVAGALFLLFYCKLPAGTRLFAKLLLMVGTSTTIAGMFYGGYLGFSPSFLPDFMQQLQQFDPIGNPLPVFYFALSLGVVQIMIGMLLKVYSAARQGALVDGILDQAPWFLMFCIGILYVLTSVGFISIISIERFGNIAIVGAVLVFLGAARKGNGIFGKFIAGAAGLYEGVGFFSDILSYSRLMALGLATSSLAFAINLIAGMVSGVPYVGFLLSFVILVIGHLFVLALNTIGSFVHSARLQFVEFFGKFIDGSGKDFSPLTRSDAYVTIVDD